MSTQELVDIEHEDIRDDINIPGRKGRRVPKKVQEAVDAYIQIHAQYKKLERQLRELRDEVIEPYMQEQKVDVIAGTFGSGVSRIKVDRPPMSSRFEAYDYDEVEEFLTEEARKHCVIPAIDAKALEACIDLGMIPEEIRELKIKLPTYQLRTK